MEKLDMSQQDQQQKQDIEIKKSLGQIKNKNTWL